MRGPTVTLSKIGLWKTKLAGWWKAEAVISVAGRALGKVNSLERLELLKWGRKGLKIQAWVRPCCRVGSVLGAQVGP